MAGKTLRAMFAWHRLGEFLVRRSRPGRSRKRLTPWADSLEVRECLSATAPSLGVDHLAHASVAIDHDAHPVRPIDPSHHEDPVTAHPLNKVAKGHQTIYVATIGKMGLAAGKSAAHPLGSLTLALKRARNGATIILAGGFYHQGAVMSGKSGITIVGAGTNVCGLEPYSGDGLKVFQSSNITIEDLSFDVPAGRGLTVVASSVTVQNINTDGTQQDGVVLSSYGGQGSSLIANNSHFDSVQLGDGLDLQDGSSATINGCTFDDDGTSPNATSASNGLVLSGSASAKITNSQFVGNTNSGLDASNTSSVTATGCTFSSNLQGDGALFFNQASVNLTDDTFASNGQVFGPNTGLNGVEFANDFTGTGVVSGSLFQGNTGNGLYIGGAPNTIQVDNNTFTGNFVGITMDSSTGSTINASVLGNTITSPGAISVGTSNPVGILAIGGGLTADIGQGNAIQNYKDGAYIYEATGDSPGQDTGAPNVTIEGTTFTQDGVSVPQSVAVHLS